MTTKILRRPAYISAFQRPNLPWLIAGLASLLLTTVLYLPGLTGPFLFDDTVNIVEPQALHIDNLNIDTLVKAATWQESSGIGRPIAMLTFALNYYVSELQTLGYKVTNLLIHLLSAVVLYVLTFRLLNRVRLSISKKLDPTTLRIASVASVALWVVHPLNLTSVLYVVQRMTSLSSFFILLGLLGYVIGRDRMATGDRRGLAVAAVSIFFFGLLATLTKEIGVLLPLYALTIELTIYRFGAGEPLQNYVKRSWITLCVVVAVCALIKYEYVAGMLNYEFRDFTLMQRLLTEPRAIWFYIKLIFLPTKTALGIYHDDIPVSENLFNPATTVFAIIGLVAMAGFAIAGMSRAPIASLGISWFLIGHSLESTVLPLELIHEHRNYLPQYGLLLLFVYYVVYPHKQLTDTVWVRRAFVTLCIVLFSGVTAARSWDWRDELTHYTNEAINHPDSARARTMLAIFLHTHGDHVRAQEQFVTAAGLDRLDSKTMLRLVQHTYLTTGKIPTDMLDELEYRLFKYSYSGVTLWTFEPLLMQTLKDKNLHRRMTEMYARLLDRTDISLDSRWREIGYQTLGFTHRETGNYRLALFYFQRAAELSPKPANNLLAAAMHLKLGKTKQAQDLVESVLPVMESLTPEDLVRLRDLQAALRSHNKAVLTR